MAAGDLTVDEVMALGETHTKAMENKKMKKKHAAASKGAQRKKTGLAASSDMLESYRKKDKKHRSMYGGGIKSLFGM